MTGPTPTPLYRVVRPDEHQRDEHGALLNPDTGTRYPSLGRAEQEDLAALCEEYGIDGDARDAVQLALLRARTRLAREHAARLRDAAEQYDAEARSYAEVVVDRYARQEPAAARDALTHAASAANAASAIRRVAL